MPVIIDLFEYSRRMIYKEVNTLFSIRKLMLWVKLRNFNIKEMTFEEMKSLQRINIRSELQKWFFDSIGEVQQELVKTKHYIYELYILL